jgi:hypothetical protein
MFDRGIGEQSILTRVRLTSLVEDVLRYSYLNWGMSSSEELGKCIISALCEAEKAVHESSLGLDTS